MASRFTITVLVVFAASAWFLFLLAQGGDVGLDFFKPATFVVGLLSTTLWGFEKWVWRWSWVNRFLKRPNLTGTWCGTLASNYVPKDHVSPVPPINVALVIHQSFTSLDLRLLTTESESESIATDLAPLPAGRYSITGLYRNEPGLSARNDSPIHYGGLRLNLQGEDLKRLAGQYWTDRGTQGELELSLVARTEATDYQMASELNARTSGAEDPVQSADV